MAHFDAIVVGTGVAGRTAAEELATAGRRTALVDCRDFGGTCVLRGCQPKKVLYNAAEAVLRMRAQTGSGVAGSARIDWPALIAFKRTFTEPMPEMLERDEKRIGIETIHGVARFTSPRSMEIAGSEHTADAFVLCLGAKPMPLGFPGEDLVIDSEAFMEVESLPERVVFIGGGYISFEMAGFAAAAGAKPVILHRSAQVLKGFDPDLVRMLVERYAEIGIEVRTDAPVAGVRPNGEALRVELGSGADVLAEMVVHGAGRVPDLADTDLETGGVDAGRQGIAVDGHMRSVSNPLVFAAGDCAALGAPLTPVGVLAARVAVRNILEPGSATFDPPVTPSVVFSQPPLASAGLDERTAAQRGIDVDVTFSDTSEWMNSRRIGQHRSGIKTLVDRGSGAIVGAHVLGAGAEDLINTYAMAIAHGVTAEELKSQLWTYPTAGYDIIYTV